MFAGSLAITLNLVFITRELDFAVAFGALFTGYAAGERSFSLEDF